MTHLPATAPRSSSICRTDPTKIDSLRVLLLTGCLLCGDVERAVAHDGGTAVEDAGRGQGQGQVAGEVVEQSGPRREDGRVDDEEVLVDQAGCVGQRTEGPGTEGGDDVGAVLLLELPQVLDGIA